jgi:hypothetical protein
VHDNSQYPKQLLNMLLMLINCRPLSAAAQELTASRAVQWVLCFRLACTLQQRQSSSSSNSKAKRQQQQQGSDAAARLMSALGVPAAWNASSVPELSKKHSMMLPSPGDGRAAVLADALLLHLQLAGGTMRRFASSQQPQVWPVVPAELAAPLPLAVLELSAQMLPQLATSVTPLTLIGCVYYLLQDYIWFYKHSTSIALAAMRAQVDSQSAAGAQSFTAHLVNPNPSREAYVEAVLELVQPLLHRLGAAVLKAVRKLEQGSGDAGSSSSSGSSSRSQLGRHLQHKSLADIADDGIGAYGAVLLRVVSEGETASTTSWRSALTCCYVTCYYVTL